MLIGKDWMIESDATNVTISKLRRVPAKEGKPAHDYWKHMGYFASPKHALYWLVNHKVTGTGMADLETVVAAIEELHTLIEGLSNLPQIARETARAT